MKGTFSFNPDESSSDMCTKSLWSIVLICLLPLSVLAQTVSDHHTSEKRATEWEVERIDQGVYWKTYHGKDYFDAKLNVNIVEVWLDSTEANFKIGYTSEINRKTSEFGGLNDALIAINGSYFNAENGKSVAFIKSAGEIVSNGAPANNFYTENGAFIWRAGENPVILPKPEEGWASVHHEHVLSSGPLLLLEGKPAAFKTDSFHQNRHPRTAVALADKNRVLFVTIDGRSFQSYGMSIPELAGFLKNQGAITALNFDGGGSTTMWIAGKKENGIVNYPSDNFEFDHHGERNVANSLLLIRNRQQK